MSLEYDLREFLAEDRAFYLGYATDEDCRREAASGGFVSSFLVYLLENDMIDAAYVTRTVMDNGTIDAVAGPAETREAVLASRTSVYMDFPFFNELDRLRDAKYRRVAVVGLPCHLKKLSEMAKTEKWLAEKIRVKIALFCAYSSTRKLIDNVLLKEGVNPRNIERLRFRTGHWRGYLTLSMKDGLVIKRPYIKHFGLYMHLFLFTCPRCLSCVDHFGVNGDIGCGDAWLPELRKHPIKHSIVMLNNAGAVDLFRGFQADNRFKAAPISPALVIKSQKRGLIRKLYCVPAFKKLAPFFGFKATYDGNIRPRWNHYLLAFLFLLNLRIGGNKTLVKLIFRLPRAVLYPYVAMLKLLNSF